MTASFLVLRVAALFAIGAAVVGQLVWSIAFWTDQGLTDIPFRIVNFVSFFTIESNIASVVVLTMGVGLTLMRRDARWYSVLRAAVVTYMATTGIVYNLLLRNVELPQGATLDWSNEILHVWGPLYMVVDWLFAPGRHRLDWKHIGTIVAFPLVWVTYTLIRGPLTFDPLREGPYYPYPFLDPVNSANGYLSVAFYVILIAAVIGLVGAGVIRISRVTSGPLARAAIADAEPRSASTEPASA